MKRLMQWVIAATLTCGTWVFTSCTNDIGDNPSPEQPKKNRTEFINHTRANLKELAENLNFSSWEAVNILNSDFNESVLNNPNFTFNVLVMFSQEILKSIKPVEEGSELAAKGYQNYAVVDFTQFNYRFTPNEDNTSFDVEPAEDFEMLFKRSKHKRPERAEGETVENDERPERPEGERPNRYMRLVLRASGDNVDMLATRISTDELAVIIRIPSTFLFSIERQNSEGEWDPDLGGTFNNDFLDSDLFADLRTDTWKISGTLFSEFEKRERRSGDNESADRPERPQGKRPLPRMKDDATLSTFAFGQNTTTHEADLSLGFEHNGKKMLDIHGVIDNQNGMTDYTTFTSSMSIGEAFLSIMTGNSIKDGTITLLDDLTTSIKVSDCAQAIQLQQTMAHARRNYADMQTIDQYTQKLNEIVSCTMTCKDLNQNIPMKLQTIKFGVDYWAVPALNFSDENGYVPMTDMLDKESIEYMINIVDHAAEPMQQSMIVVRQLVKYIQNLMGIIKDQNKQQTD